MEKTYFEWISLHFPFKVCTIDYEQKAVQELVEVGGNIILYLYWSYEGFLLIIAEYHYV